MRGRHEGGACEGGGVASCWDGAPSTSELLAPSRASPPHQALDLSGNKLDGSLPSQLKDLKYLQVLRII